MPDVTRVGIIGRRLPPPQPVDRVRAPQVPTESETITDAHPAAQNPIESFAEPQHGFAANQESPGHIPLDTSPAVRQDARLGSVDVQCPSSTGQLTVNGRVRLDTDCQLHHDGVPAARFRYGVTTCASTLTLRRINVGARPGRVSCARFDRRRRLHRGSAQWLSSWRPDGSVGAHCPWTSS